MAPNNVSGSSHAHQSLIPMLVVGVGSSGALAAVGYWWHYKTIRHLSKQAEERRREERTGRIRAEVKLRTLSKEKTALELQMMNRGEATGESASTTTTINNKPPQAQQHAMVLQCVGTVVSPYTKRMGTPRQGSLVPSSRAFIELNIQTEALDGIEGYSHLWIIFSFHANTNTFHKKTKVRPPRATGNQKVGQLATRSPHRPNPLGLSLVKMEKLDKKQKRLHISALDLVNGTPVYDIKPCVPWDIPGYNNHNNDNNIRDEQKQANALSHLRVPDWVDQKDDIHTVVFTSNAETSLQAQTADGRLAPLYTNENGGVEAARATLTEILAQDPRSSHKGLKVNQRGTSSSSSNAAATTSSSTNSSSSSYSLVFCKTQVDFQVFPWGVQVESIIAVDFDEDAYVEGIPLISEQIQKQGVVK